MRLIIATLILSSCSLFEPGAHDYMSKDLMTYKYQKSLKEMKPLVKQALIDRNSFSKSPMIILSVNPYENKNHDREFDIQNELDKKGFVYKKKFYKNKEFEIGLQDLIRGTSSEEFKKRLFNVIETGDMHLIEDSDKQFVYVESNTIVTVKKVSDNESTVEVCSLQGLVRGPINLNIDFLSMFTSSFNPLSSLKLDEGSIMMKESIDGFCNKNRGTELALFYLVEPEIAKSWEAKYKVQ